MEAKKQDYRNDPNYIDIVEVEIIGAYLTIMNGCETKRGDEISPPTLVISEIVKVLFS